MLIHDSPWRGKRQKRPCLPIPHAAARTLKAIVLHAYIYRLTSVVVTQWLIDSMNLNAE